MVVLQTQKILLAIANMLYLLWTYTTIYIFLLQLWHWLQLSVVGHNFASFLGFMVILLPLHNLSQLSIGFGTYGLANPRANHDRLTTTNPYFAIRKSLRYLCILYIFLMILKRVSTLFLEWLCYQNMGDF